MPASLRPLLAVLLLSLLSASCASFSIPNHGGGKRFLYEQKLLTSAANVALDQMVATIDSNTIPRNGYVNLKVICMGDEGSGGDGSGTGFSLGGLFGGPGGIGGGAIQSSGSPTNANSFAFANARDIEWLKGSVIRELASKGIVTQNHPVNSQGYSSIGANYLGDVYVLFPEFGVSKLGSDWLLFKMSTLKASVACEAFFLPYQADGMPEGSAMVPLGQGEGQSTYAAAFVLGIGPLGGGQFGVGSGTVGRSPFGVAPDPEPLPEPEPMPESVPEPEPEPEAPGA